MIRRYLRLASKVLDHADQPKSNGGHDGKEQVKKQAA